MIKRAILGTFILTAVLIGPSFAQDSLTEAVLTPFFSALRSGDVAALLEAVDGPMYQRNKVLLQRNENYAAVLRDRYADTDFVVDRISVVEQQRAIADILMISADGNALKRKLILEKKEGDRFWKVVDEIRIGIHN